jgi:maltooligosyltrehalose trehalohydrolase
LKLAAAAVIFSPYIPFLFMGEEYAEDVPFYYFVSHTEEELIEAVREGRKEEFAEFNKGAFESPDPQSEETFLKSKLGWDKRNSGKYKIILNWYRELIRLRKTYPALTNFDKNFLYINTIHSKGVSFERWQQDDDRVLYFFNLSPDNLEYEHQDSSNKWKKILDSSEIDWRWENDPQSAKDIVPAPSSLNGGSKFTLMPWSVCLYEAEQI